MIVWIFKGINLPLTIAAIFLLVWTISSNDPYSLRLLTTAGVFATAVIGYQFIFGHAGALSLAQGTFFGLGAYATGIIGSRYGWGFELTFPLSMGIPVLVAAAVATPVLRLETHYFALATLGVGQVILLIAINWETLTGGSNGIPGVPGIRVLGYDVDRGWPLLIFVWGVALLAALTAYLVMRDSSGRMFALMRTDPLGAMACGANIKRLRLQAFLLSAVFGGAAGSLHVHTNRVVSPDALEFHIMVTILAMTVVGGRTNISGAFVGAILLSHLAEWFRFLEHYYLLVYGTLLLLTVIAAPWGIVGTAQLLRQRIFPAPIPPAPPPRKIKPAFPPIQGLEVRGLTKRFGGIRALENVDFKVQPSEIIGLIGPNGCGKTTLINLVTGFEKADAGNIYWDGNLLNGKPADFLARSGIARTFQTTLLLEDDTGLENVVNGRWNGGNSPPLNIARGQAMECLNQVDACTAAMIPVNKLTQGIRRRVEIARALATMPSLLFLDEPAAGLSGQERKNLSATIKELSNNGLTLIIVDHDISFLSEICNRFLCLDRGKIIATRSQSEMRDQTDAKSYQFNITSDLKNRET